MTDKKLEDFEDLHREVLRNYHGRCAFVEEGMRRTAQYMFLKQMELKNLNLMDIITDTECKPRQIFRALGMESGGKLRLETLVRVADVLGVTLTLVAEEE